MATSFDIAKLTHLVLQLSKMTIIVFIENEAQTQYEVAVQSARQSHINLAKQVKAVQKTDKIPAGQLLGKDHDLVSRMDSAMLGAKGQLKENIAHNPDAGRMSISQIRELTETIKNQDSANISSSSMLNRLDSYIKESQHYRFAP